MTKTWHYWMLAFGLYGLFIFVMFGLVPVSVAETPPAIAFADFMARFVPMLDQIRKIDGFEPFMRFYYSVVWAVVPWGLVIGWRIRQVQPPKGNQLFRQASVPRIAGVGILFLVCHLTALFWPVSSGYQSWRDRSVVGNVVGVSHFTAILWGLWILAGGYVSALFERISQRTLTDSDGI